MKRKDFFKNVCKYGACGCAGMMMSPASLLANTNTLEDEKEDWRIRFMQNRIAMLIGELDDKLDKETTMTLLEDMGRYCAKGGQEDNAQFKGDVNGYLKSIENWLDSAEHDEEKGIIKLVGKKNNSCFCPFVDVSKMPKDFCNCTKGWNKETYEFITGKQVDVKIDSTVLWGGERCSFTITYS